MAVVSTAEPHHIDHLLVLLEEMDRFYDATDIAPPDLRLRQIREALFSATPAASALLAWEEDEQLVGFAAYSFLWPAVGLTQSLYLKELYVTESRRRSGIGTLLMTSLFEVATKHACSRVEWTTDDDNPDARYFYDKIARTSPSKLFYRLEGESLRRASAT